MGHAAVQDDRRVDAVLHRLGAGLQLRNHAAGDRAVRAQLADPFDRQIGNQFARFVEHADDIGEQKQARGAERPGDGAGHGVGVDVVGLAAGAHADGRDHRDQARLLERGQDPRIDLLRLADEAEVEDLLDVGRLVARGPAQLGRLDQVAVLARDADGRAAGGVYGADDALVDGPGQHHLDDLDGLGVGHAQAVDELALDLEAIEHPADLRAAAVHHDRVDADLLEQHDVAGEQPRELGVAHGVAAVLDDEGAPGIAAHERQRLGDGPGGAQPVLGVGKTSPGHGAQSKAFCSNVKPTPNRSDKDLWY